MKCSYGIMKYCCDEFQYRIKDQQIYPPEKNVKNRIWYDEKYYHIEVLDVCVRLEYCPFCGQQLKEG